MSKRLILVLALAFVVGIAFAAYAEVQNVKVSGDLTVYGIMRELSLVNNEGVADKDQSLASIVRVRIDADLTDNVMATVRLLNERYWGEETEYQSANDNSSADIVLDLAYVTMKEFLYSPLTLTIGRQELRMGSEMIVGDPDTNNAVTRASPFNVSEGNDGDLSARKAFDAIRATLNYDPLVIDIVASKIDENIKNVDDDISLYGAQATYALNKDNTVEGYYWLKHEARKISGNIPKGNRVDVVGARVVNTAIENLTASLEAAYQFGKYHNATTAARPTVERRAWALQASANLALPKVKYTPLLGTSYSYFRGEKETFNENNRGHYRGWDPMYENQKAGDIANALFAQTNAHIVTLSGTAKVTDDVSLKGLYAAFWWDKPYANNYTTTTARGDTVYFTNSRFVGSEVDLTATYDYTEDVQFGLLAGMFFPGPSLRGDYDNTATELIGSMKVTF